MSGVWLAKSWTLTPPSGWRVLASLTWTLRVTSAEQMAKREKREIHLYGHVCVEEVRLKAAQGKMTLKPGRIKNTAVGAAAVPFAGFCFQCQALCLQSTETAFHIPDQSHTQTLV